MSDPMNGTGSHRADPLPTRDETKAALAEMAQLSRGMAAAEARGGHAPEIHALMSAALPGGAPPVEVAGWQLKRPAFGGLQILDEIASPLMIGGEVKLGDIAAAMCILENEEKCWELLAGPGGVDAFNKYVRARTKDLDPQAATKIGEECFRLIRRACGIPEGAEGNGAVPAVEGTPAAVALAPTPDGSPPALNGSSVTTDGVSILPSGASPSKPPGSSSMPGRSGREESPAVPVPQNGPDSLRSENTGLIAGPPPGLEFVAEIDGIRFDDPGAFEDYLAKKRMNV